MPGPGILDARYTIQSMSLFAFPVLNLPPPGLGSAGAPYLRGELGYVMFRTKVACVCLWGVRGGVGGGGDRLLTGLVREWIEHDKLTNLRLSWACLCLQKMLKRQIGARAGVRCYKNAEWFEQLDVLKRPPRWFKPSFSPGLPYWPGAGNWLLRQTCGKL